MTKHTSPVSVRRGLFRALQGAVALTFLAVAGVASTSAGCSSKVDTPFCDGGFVRQAPTDTDPGICEGKCTAEKCGSGNTCVDNHCALPCTSHLDCNADQDCVAAVEDDTNADIAVCQPNGKGTIGAKCPFGDECGSQFACPDGKKCDPSCTGSDCPCAADACKPLVCRSAGAGDAEAYCTLQDCHADADCPGGYWCATVRDPHQICGTTKGNDNFCGTTTDPCVDPAQDSANGTTFVEGPHCALRNVCAPRRSCAPCSSDLDCSAVAGQHCKQVGAEKACVRDCRADADCESGFQCSDGSCVPRFGSCVGPGTYCTPCRNDNDCGGPTSKLACVSFGGAERVCIDVTASMSCTSNGDCPTGPDGRHGYCEPTQKKCYLPPYNDDANSYSCWGGNPGTTCTTASNCISNHCSTFDASIGLKVCCSQPGTACLDDQECCSKTCNGADPAAGTVGSCN